MLVPCHARGHPAEDNGSGPEDGEEVHRARERQHDADQEQGQKDHLHH